MKKKNIIFFLTFVIMFALAGCSRTAVITDRISISIGNLEEWNENTSQVATNTITYLKYKAIANLSNGFKDGSQVKVKIFFKKNDLVNVSYLDGAIYNDLSQTDEGTTYTFVMLARKNEPDEIELLFNIIASNATIFEADFTYDDNVSAEYDKKLLLEFV